MSVQEIESAITLLPALDVDRLAAWLEEYRADAWDRQIEADALAGRLDALGDQADRQFEAAHCRPQRADRQATTAPAWRMFDRQRQGRHA